MNFFYLVFLFAMMHAATIHAQTDSLKPAENRRITFDLEGRYIVKYPAEVTSAYEKGIVVIKIIVQSDGRVVKASVDQARSATASAGLRARARMTALQILFDPQPNRKAQEGTVTIGINHTP